MFVNKFYTCPVCGYEKMEDPPFSKEEGRSSFEFCPCCAFQFGVTDRDKGYTYEQWRDKWVKEGMLWNEGMTYRPIPADWDPVKQLEKLKANNYKVD
jgi:hypothetical protein